jgi:uncharacterized membrane protein (UPF0136 family)
MVIKTFAPLRDIIPVVVTVIAGVKTYYYRSDSNGDSSK